MMSSSQSFGKPAAKRPNVFAASRSTSCEACIRQSRSNGISSGKYGVKNSGAAIRFTDAPTICAPFFFASREFSRMARLTMGNKSAKLAASTVFMNVVFPSRCKVSAARCMFSLWMMQPTRSSARPRISGDSTMSRPMCATKSSAAFLTSFRASPTAARSAVVTCGISKPNCCGQHSGSRMRCIASRSRPRQPTFTFHLPPAAVPMWASSSGSTSSGMALLFGPARITNDASSVALPPGSDFRPVSSRRPKTVGSTGRIAGGFHSNARIVRSAPSRSEARFKPRLSLSMVAFAIVATSSFTSVVYLITPAPCRSFSWASALPSTALFTTATTSASTSKVPASAAAAAEAAAEAFAAGFEAPDAAAGAAATPFFAKPPPMSASSSSRSRSPRLRSRSSSSFARTIAKAPR
mmetsp:Transcript_97405/g.275441  ORF Transcript_97405/g.275441 Transcript_97405/m.275441 type:complete len:409 (-) Transcript_97405:377-1603(-)